MAPASQTKGPSSFPGIYKYPSRRDDAENAIDWLEGKRADDNIGKYWRVHDSLYDLEDFINKHPGGSIWIETTRGTDITEAFETSHVTNVKLVEAKLSMFYVAPAKTRRMSPYTFKEDGFYKTLKAKVEPILKEVGTGPTVAVRVLADVLIGLSILFCFYGVEKGFIWPMITSGAILAFSTVAVHNFLHLRQNWRSYYWDITLLSSYEWRISHSLSHHLYPNTLMDFEISMFEPVLEFLPKRGKSFLKRYAVGIYYHWTLVSFFFSTFLTRWKRILRGKQTFRWENGINWIHLFVMVAVAPTPWVGMRGWIIMHAASSWVLLLIGINAAHHHPDIFHDGDEARDDPDFGLCQLDAVRDRPGSWTTNLFLVMITFGNHSLHHLFPTVCHSKLPYLQHVYKEHLREFGAKFPAMTQWELYLGCLGQLARIEPKKIKIK